MTSLVLVFCLQSTPATCVEVRPMLEKVPAMECLAHGQVYATRWLEENPSGGCPAGAARRTFRARRKRDVMFRMDYRVSDADRAWRSRGGARAEGAAPMRGTM